MQLARNVVGCDIELFNKVRCWARRSWSRVLLAS